MLYPRYKTTIQPFTKPIPLEHVRGRVMKRGKRIRLSARVVLIWLFPYNLFVSLNYQKQRYTSREFQDNTQKWNVVVIKFRHICPYHHVMASSLSHFLNFVQLVVTLVFWTFYYKSLSLNWLEFLVDYNGVIKRVIVFHYQNSIHILTPYVLY